LSDVRTVTKIDVAKEEGIELEGEGTEVLPAGIG
jgi:hypothetical protein